MPSSVLIGGAFLHRRGPTVFVYILQKELIEPAVNGTLNVLKTCIEASVNRVIVVSSATAVMMNPDWPKDQPMDETCWSNTDYQKSEKVIDNKLSNNPLSIQPF